jgi:hypothetical protein
MAAVIKHALTVWEVSLAVAVLVLILVARTVLILMSVVLAEAHAQEPAKTLMVVLFVVAVPAIHWEVMD